MAWTHQQHRPSPTPREETSQFVTMLATRMAVVGSLLLLFAMNMLHPLAGPFLPLALFTLIAYLAWGVTGPLLFTVVLLLRPGELIHPGLQPLQLGKLTAAACLGFWFFRFFFLKKRHLSRDALSGLMLCLTGSIIFCSIISTYPTLSQTFLFEVWLKIVLLFFAIANLAGPHRAFRSYVTTAMWLTVVLAVMGIYKGFTASPADLVEGRVGVGKLLEDPNDYAQMLIATALPYLMNSFLLAPKKRYKVFFLVGFLTIASAIYFTKSRGGFLGFAATTLVVAQSRVSTPTMLAATGAMGALGAAFILITKRQEHVGEIDASARGRLDAWHSAVLMFIRNPIFGVGLQCFPANYLSYAVNPVSWKAVDTHSVWFKIIAELGFLGSIFFFPLIFLALWRAYHLGKWAQDQRLSEQGAWYTEALLRSVFPALVGWSVAGTFLSNCYSWFLYIQIAILIAGLTLKENWPTNPSATPKTTPAS